jgi:hypothetical protein
MNEHGMLGCVPRKGVHFFLSRNRSEGDFHLVAYIRDRAELTRNRGLEGRETGGQSRSADPCMVYRRAYFVHLPAPNYALKVGNKFENFVIGQP